MRYPFWGPVVTTSSYQIQSTVTGDYGVNGMHAQLRVELEPRGEPGDATTLHLAVVEQSALEFHLTGRTVMMGHVLLPVSIMQNIQP